jgi:hypothetical protein
MAGRGPARSRINAFTPADAFTSALLLATIRPLNAVNARQRCVDEHRKRQDTGASPYLVHTPARFVRRRHVSPIRLADAAGETSIGIVTVTVVDVRRDRDPHRSRRRHGLGAVTITATAADNVGVAGVTFFDGATQIGNRGSQVAVQRDMGFDTHVPTENAQPHGRAATTQANRASSAPVVVNVVNT